MDANRTVALALSASMAVAGCATPSKDVAAVPVSPDQYRAYDCDQLAAEGSRTKTRAMQLAGRLDQAVQDDPAWVAKGLLLDWRVLGAVGGSKQQVAEYARLKGEYDAIEQAAVEKKCAQFVRPPPTTNAPGSGSMPAHREAPLGAASAVAAPAAPANNGARPPSATPASASTTASGIGSAPAPRFIVDAEQFASDDGCACPVATPSGLEEAHETFTIAFTAARSRVAWCDADARRTSR